MLTEVKFAEQAQNGEIVFDKVTFDFRTGEVLAEYCGKTSVFKVGTADAFAAISEAWLRSGWDSKYVYSFSWLGRPIIQHPEDIIRIQEVFYSVQPDLLIETGIAHGGSAVFYASLCKTIDRGHVVAIDIDIRQHNRQALEEHFLRPYMTLIEGNSTSAETFDSVQRLANGKEKVMVVLDSCHSKSHVLQELELYSRLVTSGSYIVVMDGAMKKFSQGLRSEKDWIHNNPLEAAREFVGKHSDFVIDEPPFPFNEGAVSSRVTYSPYGFIKRL